jgi:multidrug efflux pump subunit AcrA (membrane-fusion protein)
MKQIVWSLSVTLLLLYAQRGFAAEGTSAGDPVLANCVVQLEDDIKVPAPEAGVLVQLSVKEGSQVQRGQVLAKVYDEEVKIQKQAAEYALGAAHKAAKDDIQQRYAKASAAVAEQNYKKMLESNQAVAKAVTEVDVMKAKLEWDAAILSAEKAEHDQELAKYEYGQKMAERDGANLALKRRQIVAPFEGEVVTVFRHQDEWVSPGDPILRLVKLDTMLVDGVLEQSAFDPHEVMGCDVTVEIELARGRKEQFNGRITLVSPVLRYDGRYSIRAEIANRQVNGRWLLGERMVASMTIHLNTAAGDTLDLSQRP